MFRPLRKKRKIITGVALATWLFALFIGVAHACAWAHAAQGSRRAVVADSKVLPYKSGALTGCEQFCKLDVPVVTKLPPVDDQSNFAPLIVAVSAAGPLPVISQASWPARPAYLSSDAPRLLRFTHLRL